MLLGVGHGVAVDWWSFGTLVYEMLSGCPPFYSRSLPHMYRAILSAELQFGPHVSRRARRLLQGLLMRDPRRRLGASGSAALRRHAFFAPLDMRRVLARSYTPAFRPTLQGASPSARALDVSNFDERFTAEDPHCDEVPAPAAPTAAPAPPPAPPPPHERATAGSSAPPSESSSARASFVEADAHGAFAAWTYAAADARSSPVHEIGASERAAVREPTRSTG